MRPEPVPQWLGVHGQARSPTRRADESTILPSTKPEEPPCTGLETGSLFWTGQNKTKSCGSHPCGCSPQTTATTSMEVPASTARGRSHLPVTARMATRAVGPAPSTPTVRLGPVITAGECAPVAGKGNDLRQRRSGWAHNPVLHRQPARRGGPLPGTDPPSLPREGGSVPGNTIPAPPAVGRTGRRGPPTTAHPTLASARARCPLGPLSSPPAPGSAVPRPRAPTQRPFVLEDTPVRFFASRPSDDPVPGLRPRAPL